MTDEELKNAGGNISLVHEDFMVGSDALNITAETFEGKTVEIFKDGEFVI